MIVKVNGGRYGTRFCIGAVPEVTAPETTVPEGVAPAAFLQSGQRSLVSPKEKAGSSLPQRAQLAMKTPR